MAIFGEQLTTGSDSKITVGISGCLDGQPIRFDGGRLKCAALAAAPLKDFLTEPFCPEVAVGLGVPREPLRVVGTDRGLRVGTKDDADHDLTRAVTGYGQTMLERACHWHGMIVAGGSPSCGMERMKRYSARGGILARDGQGVYTATLRKYLPWLPVEEQGRLEDHEIRKNFLNRVHVCFRWRALNKQGLSAEKLLGFHRQHKILVLAHSPQAYKKLGKLVANLKADTLANIASNYFIELMAALEQKATVGRHTNVLQHMQGYLKDFLDDSDKRELTERITLYRQGKSLLEAPVALLWRHLRRSSDNYMQNQYYFFPLERGQIDAEHSLPQVTL